MPGHRGWYFVGTILLASLIAGIGWDRYLSAAMQDKYGASPGLAASFVSPDDTSCQRIVVVHPVAHYNWLGRIWQDESLDWSDVQIQHPPPQEFEHNHSGPVKVGDIICGFGEVSDIRYVHRPTGIVLTETCESYRCPLE